MGEGQGWEAILATVPGVTIPDRAATSDRPWLYVTKDGPRAAGDRPVFTAEPEAQQPAPGAAPPEAVHVYFDSTIDQPGSPFDLMVRTPNDTVGAAAGGRYDGLAIDPRTFFAAQEAFDLVTTWLTGTATEVERRHGTIGPETFDGSAGAAFANLVGDIGQALRSLYDQLVTAPGTSYALSVGQSGEAASGFVDNLWQAYQAWVGTLAHAPYDAVMSVAGGLATHNEATGNQEIHPVTQYGDMTTPEAWAGVEAEAKQRWNTALETLDAAANTALTTLTTQYQATADLLVPLTDPVMDPLVPPAVGGQDANPAGAQAPPDIGQRPDDVGTGAPVPGAAGPLLAAPPAGADLTGGTDPTAGTDPAGGLDPAGANDLAGATDLAGGPVGGAPPVGVADAGAGGGIAATGAGALFAPTALTAAAVPGTGPATPGAGAGLGPIGGPAVAAPLLFAGPFTLAGTGLPVARAGTGARGAGIPIGATARPDTTGADRIRAGVADDLGLDALPPGVLGRPTPGADGALVTGPAPTTGQPPITGQPSAAGQPIITGQMPAAGQRLVAETRGSGPALGPQAQFGYPMNPGGMRGGATERARLSWAPEDAESWGTGVEPGAGALRRKDERRHDEDEDEFVAPAGGTALGREPEGDQAQGRTR